MNRFWNWMGGRRNTMIWAAFLVACSSLYVMRGGKPIATFGEWMIFVPAIISLLVAGIVIEEKFQKVKDVELAKVASIADVAKVEGQAEVNKIEAEEK